MKGPLANSYWAAVALVICALTPFLVLTTALTPLEPLIVKQVGLGHQALQLTIGMGSAAYAFGTITAIQLGLQLPGRRLLVLYATLFVAGSIMAAGAWTPGVFIAGHVLQGGCTSLMLISAVPPLVTGWPVERMPITGAVMNMCIFGAVALGPVVGGAAAGSGTFRALFWTVAGVGVLALVLALLTYEDVPALDRTAPVDLVAQVLAGGGCAAAFFGASELETHRFMSLIVFLPLLAGLGMIIALLLFEYHAPNPLVPLRRLASTFPVVGIIAAMSAGAASVAMVELAQTVLSTKTTPTHAGMLFWPEFGAAAATAILFALLFRTRWIPLLVISGLAVLAGAGAVMSGAADGPNSLITVGSGLVGFGVGASVSPALFMAAFSLPSQQVQRVFAVVELLRAVAAFMFAPVVLHLAMTVGGSPAAGTRTAMWVCLAVAAGGGALSLYLLVLGRARLQRPRLDSWQEQEGPAYRSPPLLAGIRGETLLPAGRPGLE